MQMMWIPDMARVMSQVMGIRSRSRLPASLMPRTTLPDFMRFRPVHVGPGHRTLDTIHKKVGRSRYRPHQGSAERFRRWKRMELKREISDV